MPLLDLLTNLLRPRTPALAAGAGAGPASPPTVEGPAAHTLAAVTSAAGMSGGVAPDVADAEAEPEEREPTEREKRAMLHLSNVSHAINHFQNQMMTMLYPFIMADLGMSYLDIGVLSAVRSVSNSFSQGAYGFVTPFFSRCKILGFSNIAMAAGTFMSGMAGSFPVLIVARCVSGLGASAQHPVGYSVLASYFPKTRGAIIALNTSASNVGTLLATPLATFMLLFMGWREIFYVVAFLSIAMGVVYFLFRDYGATNRSGSKRSRLAQGFGSYGRVLKNRNMLLMGLVFMVGAAGGEGGVNQTYLAPHLTNDFGYAALTVGILITAVNIGQIVGPILFGWLSDRMSRVKVLQASMVLSIPTTLAVGWLGPGEVALFLTMFVYSAVTTSRGTLTQAIVADSATDLDRDAAFSLYFLLGFLSQPIWLLLTGYLMDTAGFSFAMSRLSLSYLAGIALLFFMKDARTEGVAKA